mgnify:CR=1 FL=1
MVFMVLGVLLLALKLAEINPVAGWSWFVVLAPFAMAVAWWAFSDATGRTKRVGMQKEEARKLERRRNLAQGMGLQGLFDRSVAAKLRLPVVTSLMGRGLLSGTDTPPIGTYLGVAGTADRKHEQDAWKNLL